MKWIRRHLVLKSEDESGLSSCKKIQIKSRGTQAPRLWSFVEIQGPSSTVGGQSVEFAAYIRIPSMLACDHMPMTTIIRHDIDELSHMSHLSLTSYLTDTGYLR